NEYCGDSDRRGDQDEKPGERTRGLIDCVALLSFAPLVGHVLLFPCFPSLRRGRSNPHRHGGMLFEVWIRLEQLDAEGDEDRKHNRYPGRYHYLKLSQHSSPQFL